MRPGLFDESKIIKKEDQQKESIEKIPELEKDEKIYQDAPPITIINKDTISNLEIDKTEVHNENKQLTSNIKKQKVVDSKPVFIFERDNETKQVKTTGKIQNKIIDVDIPNDQLTLIYVNTIRAINEIKVNLEVLKILISESQDNSYYIASQKELILQLTFNNKKLEILKQLIK